MVHTALTVCIVYVGPRTRNVGVKLEIQTDERVWEPQMHVKHCT
jgi:hypothetical protein